MCIATLFDIYMATIGRINNIVRSVPVAPPNSIKLRAIQPRHGNERTTLRAV